MNSENSEALLPGEDFFTQGLAYLAKGVLSESALLVLVAGPRLGGWGSACRSSYSMSLTNMRFIRLSRNGRELSPFILQQFDPANRKLCSRAGETAKSGREAKLVRASPTAAS